jgi:hypothetical protein
MAPVLILDTCVLIADLRSSLGASNALLARVGQGLFMVDAMQAELLELYNDTWRQDDEPELSAEELTKRLNWQLLTVSANDIVPVEFSYDAGHLFGDHGVTIEVDESLDFRDIDLRG